MIVISKSADAVIGGAEREKGEQIESIMDDHGTHLHVFVRCAMIYYDVLFCYSAHAHTTYAYALAHTLFASQSDSRRF
jgi:hypothetical protein